MSSTAPKILDVGCGSRKTPGSVGMDVLADSAADVIADLNEPWPFPDRSFDQVVANHVLEHVPDVVHVMNEAWRVLRPGGTMIVRGPHFSSPELIWSDPTHRRGLSLAMFKHFEPGTAHPYSKAKFRVKRGVLRVPGARLAPVPSLWRRASAPGMRALESWINRSEAEQNRAERMWSRFVPCDEVEVELEAVGE